MKNKNITKDQIIEIADSVFESKDKANSWFDSKILALGFQKPTELLKTQDGRNLIYDCLMRIEHSTLS